MSQPNANASPWQPLDALRSVFTANVDALATRDATLASRLRALSPRPRMLRQVGDQLQLAVVAEDGKQAVIQPNPVPPAAAAKVAQQLCPGGNYTHAVLVAGIDQGWLWQTLYNLPANVPTLPGYRAPIYLLAHDLERLWTALHLHDWRKLLVDNRVQIFAGTDALALLRAALLADPMLTWPKLSVTVEPAVWPDGVTLDGLLAELNATVAPKVQALHAQNEGEAAHLSEQLLADQFRSGRPLRVLGITSRYTTFLQHSMRDWLDAFARLGHETHLVIESADHEIMTNVGYARVVAEFRPDLVVLIDHYRAELGAIPANVPCVMWVQDQLPNIFSDKGGAAQTRRDYCLGSGRLLLSTRHGYPADRFLPAPVCVNESRFAPRELSADEERQFACDVSFVSHASVPADVLMSEQLRSADAATKRLLSDVFDRLRAIYEAGGCVSHPLRIRTLIEQSAAATGARVGEQQMPGFVGFFSHRINNALFRHQALLWLADLDIDLRLYGRGWESHPELGRFARGVADNNADLATIYRASRINLQVTPHGTVHQRLFEGVAAGGFFLLRTQPAEELDALYGPLAAWCERERIVDDDDLRRRATPEVRELLHRFRRLTGVDPLALEFPLTREVRQSAECGFALAAGGAIPEYEAVAFDSRNQLRERVRHYLAHPADRRRVAESVRGRVLERYTYTAVTRKLLSFIADDLGRSVEAGPVAAAA